MKSQFVLDRYEKPERECLKQYLDAHTPAIELGGCLGVISCLTNRRLALPDQRIVIKANPALVNVLQRNKLANGSQFTVLHRAVAYSMRNEVEFCVDENYVTGSNVRATGNHIILVQTVTLLEIIKAQQFERVTLICDIEGTEGGSDCQ